MDFWIPGFLLSEPETSMLLCFISLLLLVCPEFEQHYRSVQHSEEIEGLAFWQQKWKEGPHNQKLLGKSWKGKNLGSRSITLCMNSALSRTFVILIQIRGLTITVKQNKESKVIQVRKEKNRAVPFTDDMIVYVKNS